MKKDFSAIAKILAVVAIFSLMFGGFIIKRRKSRITEATKLPYHNVELRQVPDGIFTARAETSFLRVELAVTVREHKIVNIKIIESEGLDSVPAKPVLDKMILENKTAVQVVKNAELGSLVYISCADAALYAAISEN